jgi:hypothetical protein
MLLSSRLRSNVLDEAGFEDVDSQRPLLRLDDQLKRRYVSGALSRRVADSTFVLLAVNQSKMLIGILTVIFLVWSVVFGSCLPPVIVASSFAVQPSQGARGTFRVREPNLHVPNLYGDKIDFVATLVDLPGARKKQSYWELSYQLFFVPEERYYETIQRLPSGGSNPTPQEFSGRILLAEGHKKKTGLETLEGRTITLTGVPFKQKVPDALRTKFAYLMTGYSLKIFDAELNTTIYRSGIFLTQPYEASLEDQKQDSARKTIYLTFLVTSDGKLNRSQLRP